MRGAVKVRAGLYKLEGVRCGGPVYRGGVPRPCGGQVYAERMATEDAAAAYRWEAYCGDCQECDPNGYPTLRETVAAAPEFWGAEL